MPQLLRFFIDLSLFRRKPQDLPASGNLLGIMALLAFASYFVSNGVLAGMGKSFSISLAQTALFGAAVWLILFLHGKRERWSQVMTALYGVSALLHVVALAPVLWIDRSGPEQAEAAVPFLLVGAINFWFLIITAVAFREALEVSMPMALLISFVCDLSVALLLVYLFGPLV